MSKECMLLSLEGPELGQCLLGLLGKLCVESEKMVIFQRVHVVEHVKDFLY